MDELIKKLFCMVLYKRDDGDDDASLILSHVQRYVDELSIKETEKLIFEYGLNDALSHYQVNKRDKMPSHTLLKHILYDRIKFLVDFE